MDKNPPTNAGDRGLIPGLGRPHMLRRSKAPGPQLLSLHALEPLLHHERSHHKERALHHNYRGASAVTKVLYSKNKAASSREAELLLKTLSAL